MASILKSQAAFEERARECGLTQGELDVLVRKGLTSLSLLAFSVSTPGEVPQEAELRSTLDPTEPANVPASGPVCTSQVDVRGSNPFDCSAEELDWRRE